MGWDAFSSAESVFDLELGEEIFKKPEVAKLFKEASEFVKNKTGAVDMGLQSGWLDVSTCARMLEKATGCSCWDEKGWDDRTVKMLNEVADWNFHASSGDAWAYWSARKFLEVCAQAGLSISFSY